MPFPINLHIGDREVSSHLIFEILGIFIGFRYYLFAKKRTVDAISNDDRWKIFAAVCFGAFFGSRLVGNLEDPEAFMAAENKFVYIFSNKTIVGGLIGGLFVVEFVKRRLGVSASSGDLMTIPIILGLIIGRIGCFLEGMNDGVIGSVTNLPFGIDFGDGFNRHPLPLYEILFLVVIWVTIVALRTRYALADGAKFKLFMIAYLVFRFLQEFLKDGHFTFLGLSTIQFATLIGIVYYYNTILKPKTLFVRA